MSFLGAVAGLNGLVKYLVAKESAANGAWVALAPCG